MPSAEILTIGTEILLGEIVDTNSAYLARHLRDLNVDVFRTSTVGDNAQRIAATLQEILQRADIIITTGGLGPTVDDPTRDAVAMAFGRTTEFLPELWDQVVERVSQYGRVPTENQKRQAYVPQGAIPLRNPVGTAPAFIVEDGNKCVISLPGVPREMEYLAENEVFPYLRKRYNLKGIIKARVLHTAGIGEAVLDEKVGDLEKLSNPTLGLAAHTGQVDVRITAKSETLEEADALIADMERTLRERLGNYIYGADAETLEAACLAAVAGRGWTLSALDVNTGGELSRRLSQGQSSTFRGGKILPGLAEGQSLADVLAATETAQGEVKLALTANTTLGSLEVEILLATPEKQVREKRGYGGPPKSVIAWGATLALDILRREMLGQ